MEICLSKKIFIIILLSLSFSCSSQNSQTTVESQNRISSSQGKQVLKVLFIGDIMEHDLQIESSYNSRSGHYDFSEQFKNILPIIRRNDLTIANFEVTLKGKPYKGYPKFSSPDQLAVAIKKAGIDYLGLANNHINDYGQAGINRTLKIIDSLGLHRTGVFYNQKDKKKHNPMIINKNGFRIAVFNYTYGLNNKIVQKPAIVNIIDSMRIEKDLKAASTQNYDAEIVFFHWGKQYERIEDKTQDAYADLCFKNGATVVIGSHPHVIEPMKYYNYKMPKGKKRPVLVAFSLGNYVSNYGNWRFCDGGAMIQFAFEKKNNHVVVTNPKYYLIWVYRKPKSNKKRHYYVIPVQSHKYDKYMTQADKKQLQRFINDSRSLLKKNNLNVPEAKY